MAQASRQTKKTGKTGYSIPKIEVRNAAVDADVDVIGVSQDSSKKAVAPKGAYGEAVERLRKGDAFAAKPAQLQFVRFGGAEGSESALYLGLGAAGELTDEKARQAGGMAWAKLSSEKARVVSVQADTFGKEAARAARAFAEGIFLSAYQFNKYRSAGAPEYQGPSRFVFVAKDKTLAKKLGDELALVAATAECVNVTRDWSNEPSNGGTPEFYAAEAQKLARANGLKARVLTERDAAREKMGLFLGVGQGSAREGRIVVVEYAPPKAALKSAKTIALVGKGVTFDSGGISIKPSLRMEDMKHDMTGAATVMGAVLLAARMKAANHVVGIMAFTENMPSGDAIQPGNVLRARNGKTVEIINTDAEGRLVLGDVLDFAHEFKPDAIVDIATLTGAVSIALGKQACAVLGNDENVIEALTRIGSGCGERMWQLPLWDEYFEDMKSDTADMKNSCNDSYGGTIRGAMFLKQFIRKGVPWAHLDIAGMSNGVSHIPYLPKKGATGLYVRTLARFAAEF